MKGKLGLGVLVGFLAYTGAYIFVYLWRAFRLDLGEEARTVQIWHGDPFGRAILVSVLFLIGLVIAVHVALTRRLGQRSGQVRIRADLWDWLQRRSEETNESPGRLAERAIASYRGRMEAGGGAGPVGPAGHRAESSRWPRSPA